MSGGTASFRARLLQKRSKNDKVFDAWAIEEIEIGIAREEENERAEVVSPFDATRSLCWNFSLMLGYSKGYFWPREYYILRFARSRDVDATADTLPREMRLV